MATKPAHVRGYGWHKPSIDFRDHLYHVTPLKQFPPQVDLRALCPPVYNQGQLGSCTANMGAGMLQYVMLQEHFKDTSVPSRLFMYYNERLIDGDVNSDSGAECRDALKVIATYGSIPETELPYDVSQFTVKPSDKCYSDATLEKNIEYAQVDPSLVAIKTVLASGLPVGFGFNVYDSFESEQVALTGIVPVPAKGWGFGRWRFGAEQCVGGHAVVRVGYLDNAVLPMTLKNGAILQPHVSSGYWIVRNSWGASFGDAGYVYMPYGMDDDCSDFWVLKAIS